MTEQEKMLSGQLYFAGGPDLLAARKKAKELCQRFNQIGRASCRERV